MSQLSLFGMQSEIWTVARLNRYVRQVLESDYRLQDIWVAGEVSNLSTPSSGHLYFTLKDAQAAVRCVMWRSDVETLAEMPHEGQGVEVHGQVSVYETGGQYQLYVDAIRPSGEGLLFQEFLRLRARLESEGLFASEHKRPLPAWPERIGVVTSPTGAALHDVLNVLRRRFPMAVMILAPTLVQGEDAPAGIVRALEALNTYARPDVILLVRGGGSMEDLWAFNDEGVARAVYDSAAPVVCGVGHEVDFTIADFVADVRAPTPSAAAEMATPDIAQVSQELGDTARRLVWHLEGCLRQERLALQRLRTALLLASPRTIISNARQRLDELARRIRMAHRHGLLLRLQEVRRLGQTLGAVGPQAVLARGYAVVRRADDLSVVRSVKQVKAGDQLTVRVADGDFGAKATG
jgi:exodeoxyribonuclease VII large subunit